MPTGAPNSQLSTLSRRERSLDIGIGTMAKSDDAAALDRADLTDPSTWKISQTTLKSLEDRCLAGLRAKGYPATSVELDPAKLKGGYICDSAHGDRTRVS